MARVTPKHNSASERYHHYRGSATSFFLITLIKSTASACIFRAFRIYEGARYATVDECPLCLLGRQ